VTLRRAIYWLTLAAIAVLFFVVTGDNASACAEAANSFPNDEWGTGGIELVPPAYSCLFIGGDTTVALDLGGWVRWSTTLAFPGLLAYGAVSFIVRRRRAARAA
jgi:hypothetical protein